MATNRLSLARWRVACMVAVAVTVAVTVVAPATALQAQTQAKRHEITVVSRGNLDTIPLSEFSGVEMLPLEALANLVSAEVRPAPEQSVSLFANGRQARLTDGRNFVSVGGKLVLLQSPVRLVSGNWFVPLDFLSKVLTTLSSEPLAYRESERMLMVGNTFPTLQVKTTRDPTYTRVEVGTTGQVPIEMSRVDNQIRLSIHTPFLTTDFRDEEILDEVVQRIRLQHHEREYELVVELGPRFGTLKAFERQSPEHGIVLDLLRSRVPTAAGGPPPRQPGDVETIHEDLRPIDEREADDEAPLTGEPDPTSASAGAGDHDRVTTIDLGADSASPASAAEVLERGRSGPARLRVVCLDPGHGGPETGAEGKGGLIEKDVALSLARRLRTLLQDRLGVRVVLTRDGDRDLALDDRAALANNNKADVFISIHADASPRRDARGSSVYFLSYSGSEASASQVTTARDPGSTPRAAGGDGELDFILWDMAQASHLNQSSRLAEIFQEELLGATGASEKINRGIKQNTFRVLKGATMPAVLVEVGFISNPDEEELLGTPTYQDRLAEALYRGVLRYKDVYEYEPSASDRSAQGRK
jgi:N-acetylmuramoyl-L-alanine amidase